MRISDWSSDVCSSDLFLEDVVARRRRARRKAQSRVVLDVAPDVSPRPFGAADVKILAEMPGKNRPQHVQRQTDREHPGEEEVPAPPVGKAVAGRDGRPARKGPGLFDAFGIGPAPEDAGRLDLPVADAQIAEIVSAHV